MTEVCCCPELAAAVKDGVHMGCGKVMAESYEIVCGECHVLMLEAATEGCPVTHSGHYWVKVPAAENAA